MIVVDAQAWVDRLVGVLADEHRLMLRGEVTSPAHVDFEVGSALRRMERDQRLGAGVTARELVAVQVAIPFERGQEGADLVVGFDLLSNAGYADAVYLAMAKRLACPVMTSDKGMIEAARINEIDVIDTRVNGADQADE